MTVPTTEQRKDIESFITDWMIDHNVPGASIAVVDSGNIVYTEGFGARNFQTNAPATAETLYGVGSATKPFTALAVFKLVERGEIALDDPIAEYVSALTDVSGKPITVEELLTHTSGMPSDDTAATLIPRMALGTGPEIPLSSRADFQRHVNGATNRRITDVDDRFMYYNTGYTLLGRLIEAVTDQTYSEYIVQNIFQPLDMERSTFTRETFEAETNVMTPYYYDGEQLQESEVPFDEHLHAAGGLLSSVTEIASFLSLYLGENKMPDVGIDADKLATMRQPQATMSTLLDGTEIKYGYGWMIQPLISDTLVGHGGWTGVSSAYCGGLLDAGLGVVIACNSGPDLTPMAIGKGVLSILQNQEPDQTISSLIIREKYSRITGEYTSYRGIQKATVEQDDQVLYLTQDTGLGEQTLPLIPEGFEPDDYTFYTITSSGTRVTADFCVGENEVELTFDRMCFVSSNHYIL